MSRKLNYSKLITQKRLVEEAHNREYNHLPKWRKQTKPYDWRTPVKFKYVPSES